jgi:peptidyl-prolyl cis-trans isomerase A (cyclophilin A)
MLHFALAVAVVAGLSSVMVLRSVEAAPQEAKDDKPVVVLETSAGDITVELDKAKAPITVENFLGYVDKGFYSGVSFHRVMDGFMIQTGGMVEKDNVLNEKRKEALAPIKNESGNGLSNVRGSLAMARTSDPNSATSQFFINLVDNKQLDNYGGGYAVFGKVTAGLDVVDKIAKVRTTNKRDSDGNTHQNVPVDPIVIKSAKRMSK